MFKNYLKIAIRNLWRSKIYTFINILGLSVGIACSILLFVYIQFELSYDTFHKDVENIYRANTESSLEEIEESTRYATTSSKLAEVLKKDYPEVIQTARMLSIGRERFIEYKDKKLYDSFTIADSTIFEILSYKFIAGNPKKALVNPRSVVLTESLALKLFENVEDALNKEVEMNNDTATYLITGIIQDVPKNSAFQFNALLSLSTYHEWRKDHPCWGWPRLDDHTFVKLQPGTNPQVMEEKFEELYERYMKTRLAVYKRIDKIKLEKVKDIHLYSKLEAESAEIGDVAYVYVFSAISLFILLIAAINYINLATARSLDRAREVGIRKVVGSYRWQLMSQFLMESGLLTLVAFILGLCLVELAMPFFREITGHNLQMPYWNQPYFLLILFGASIVLGLISGFYPALVLSGFKPVSVLKGKFSRNKQGVFLRKTLVVFQFAISVILISATWGIYEQITFINQKNLGYNKEQIVSVEVRERNMYDRMDVIKEELKKNPNILGVSSAQFVPGQNNVWSTSTFFFDGEGKKLELSARHIDVDYDFMDVLKMKLIEGRNFSPKFSTDDDQAVIVNETLVEKMGWEIGSKNPKLNPIGQNIESFYDQNGVPQFAGKVIGVVQDFHQKSLHNPIDPMLMMLEPESGWDVLVKINTENVASTLQHIETTWKKFDPDHPYEATFVDQFFRKQYEAEYTRGRIFLSFATLAIGIACLGLLGLAVFTARQRSREIGIRKVLGASLLSLFQLLSKDFIVLVFIASIIAFPVAYYLMQWWLGNFAYKISINFISFILSALLAMMMSLVTVAYQAWKTALINPIEILRDE